MVANMVADTVADIKVGKVADMLIIKVCHTAWASKEGRQPEAHRLLVFW